MEQSPTYSMRWQKHLKEQEDKVIAKADETMEGFSYHSKIYFEGVNKPNELFVSQDQVYPVLVERDKQITTLKNQLKRHGGHTKDCACREPYITKTGAIKEVPKCDCGFDEVMKGL